MPHTDPPDHSLLIGQIHGIVQQLQQGQQETHDRLTKLDDRLRGQEQRSAAAGAGAGAAMSVGIALVIESLKTYLRRGGADG